MSGIQRISLDPGQMLRIFRDDRKNKAAEISQFKTAKYTRINTALS